MASDPTLPLRQAIVTHLRADADLIALGSPPLGNRIYGEKTPATLIWPFVRYGQTDLGQSRGALPLHVFSKSEFTDEAAKICAAIVESLDGKRVGLAGGRKVVLSWPEAGGTQIVQDAAEASAYHGIVRFDVLVPRECPA